MSFQIDVFPTDRGSAAVCVRYRWLGEYRIMLYDGGMTDTGFEIVKHIREHYGTDTVDDAVCSHPNVHHVLGMWPVLSNLKVHRLWLHRPWEHSEQIARYMLQGKAENEGLEEHYDHTVSISHVIREEALQHNVPVLAPFQGVQIGPFTVLGPHPDWYARALVPQFSLPPLVTTSAATAMTAASATMRTMAVRAEMESSVVLYGELGGQGILLTGNAGPMALTRAANYAQAQVQRMPIAKHLLLQIPHSGDGRHVTPALLNRLIGLERPATWSAKRPVTALITTPEGGAGYPHRALLEALHRRGASVAQVCGKADGPYRLEQDEAGQPFRLTPLAVFNAGVK